MIKTIDILNYIRAIVPYQYFVNDFPATAPDESAFIRIQPGSLPSEWTSVVHPGFQVIVRAGKYGDADSEATANAILDVMHNRNEFEIAGQRIVHCTAEQSAPFYLGVDENERPLYSLNFEMTMMRR